MQELKPSDIALLQALADGATPKGIAFDAARGMTTIKKRMAKIRRALGAETTTHAVAIALRQALIR